MGFESLTDNSINKAMANLQHVNQVDREEIKNFAGDINRKKFTIESTKGINGQDNITITIPIKSFDYTNAVFSPEKGFELVAQHLANTASTDKNNPVFNATSGKPGPDGTSIIITLSGVSEEGLKELRKEMKNPKLADNVLNDLPNLYKQKFRTELKEQSSLQNDGPNLGMNEQAKRIGDDYRKQQEMAKNSEPVEQGEQQATKKKQSYRE